MDHGHVMKRSWFMFIFLFGYLPPGALSRIIIAFMIYDPKVRGQRLTDLCMAQRVLECKSTQYLLNQMICKGHLPLKNRKNDINYLINR